MPCPACTTRILRIFLHDIPARVSHRQLLHTQARSPTTNRFTPPARQLQFQQTRLLTQNHQKNSSYGVAYNPKRLSDDDYLPFIQEISPAEPQPPIALGRGDARIRGENAYPNGLAPAPPTAPSQAYKARDGDEMVAYKPGFGRGQRVFEQEVQRENVRDVAPRRAEAESQMAFEREQQHFYRSTELEISSSESLQHKSAAEDAINTSEKPSSQNNRHIIDSANHQAQIRQGDRRVQFRSEKEKLLMAMDRLDDPDYLGEDVDATQERAVWEARRNAVVVEQQEVRSQKDIEQIAELEELEPRVQASPVIEIAHAPSAHGFEEKAVKVESVPGSRIQSRLLRKLRRGQMKAAEEEANIVRLSKEEGKSTATMDERLARSTKRRENSTEKGKSTATMDERLARSTKRRENPKEEEKSTATRDERLARSSKRRENSNSAISVPQTKNDWKSLQSQMYTQADAKSQDTQDLHEAVAHLGMPIAGAATSHAEATSRATIDSEQPQYTNRWSLPPLENPKLLAPTRRRRHSQLAPSRSESAQQVVYQRILDSPYEHPKWLVQKAAIALKLKGQTWCPPKRISPGTVMLIKSISRQSPNLFTAAELAAKFKITPEAVRKVLKSKWMPKEGSDDAEDRLRRWLKRGEVIRGAKIEKGQIWTQEERKRRYEKNVAKAELDRLREMFGPKPEKNRGEDGEDESTPVTLGRISLSTKIL